MCEIRRSSNLPDVYRNEHCSHKAHTLSLQTVSHPSCLPLQCGLPSLIHSSRLPDKLFPHQSYEFHYYKHPLKRYSPYWFPLRKHTCWWQYHPLANRHLYTLATDCLQSHYSTPDMPMPKEKSGSSKLPKPHPYYSDYIPVYHP